MPPVVAAVSDMHGVLPRGEGGYPDVPDCDVLVIGGDICPDFESKFDKGETRQANWLHDDFRQWLVDTEVDHIVGIAGNHDFVFERGLQPGLPWTYLQDSLTRVCGLSIYGTPWCPRLGRWAFYADERRLRAVYEAVPEYLDILISHSPPHGYGDSIPPMSRFNPSKQEINVGTHQLTNILYEKKPKAVVSGHIHEARGVYEYHSHGTKVYNVSYLTAAYKPHEPPACTILDLS